MRATPDGGRAMPVTLSVNVSPIQFAEADFVHQVLAETSPDHPACPVWLKEGAAVLLQKPMGLDLVAATAIRLIVDFFELAFADIAVIALQLLLGFELQAVVGGLALARGRPMHAGPVFTLVDRRFRSAPQVFADAAVKLVLGANALCHQSSLWRAPVARLIPGDDCNGGKRAPRHEGGGDSSAGRACQTGDGGARSKPVRARASSERPGTISPAAGARRSRARQGRRASATPPPEPESAGRR